MKTIWLVVCMNLFQFSIDEGKPAYTAFIFLHESCLISQYYSITLKHLSETFQDDNIEFIGVFPNSISTEESIDSFRKIYDLPFKMMKDHDQLITRKYKAEVTPEIIIVDNTADNIIYKGRIDDTYFRVGKRRTITTTSEFEDVLVSLKENRPVTTEFTTSIGCLIQFDN